MLVTLLDITHTCYCDFYSDITQDLMERAQDIDVRFNNMCSFDKFCFLMSHEQLQVDSAKACQKILPRRQHTLCI